MPPKQRRDGEKTFLLLILLAFGACTTRPVVQVSRIGELEDMIKKGDLAAKAKLADFSNSPNSLVGRDYRQRTLAPKGGTLASGGNVYRNKKPQQTI